MLRRTIAAILVLTALLGLGFRPASAHDDWQRGVILWDHPPSYGSPRTVAALDQLVATQANTVVLVVPRYVRDAHGSTLAPGPFTPTDDELVQTIQESRQRGADVVLFLRVDCLDGTWRARIDPGDKTRFFADYQRFVGHYAAIAQDNGVHGLVVGSETPELTRPELIGYWRSIVGEARSRFGGFLTYGAQWGSGGPQSRGEPLEEYTRVPFWALLDYIGIAAYFDLADQPDARPTRLQLAARWAEWRRGEIAPLQALYGKPVLFVEVGYQSRRGAAARPWDGIRSDDVDLEAQADLYAALFEAWHDVPWFGGVYVWHWSTNPAAGGRADPDYTPQNKPAAGVLREWFGSRAPALASAEAEPTAPAEPPARPASPANAEAQQADGR